MKMMMTILSFVLISTTVWAEPAKPIYLPSGMCMMAFVSGIETLICSESNPRPSSICRLEGSKVWVGNKMIADYTFQRDADRRMKTLSDSGVCSQ